MKPVFTDLFSEFFKPALDETRPTPLTRAAPEMLCVLEHLVAMDSNSSTLFEKRAIIELAKKVIAKARGEG